MSEAPSWLEMRPGHFDTRKLPKRHRTQDPDSLWTVADLLPSSAQRTATRNSPEPLEGQAELFPLGD